MRIERWYSGNRLGGLRRFAAAISVLVLLGHTVLGFELSFAHPLAALATTYSLALALELVDARAAGRQPAWRSGLVDFLLPAHISGLAVSMLLYPGDRVLPIVFASAAAIGSKAVFRVRVDGRSRHFLNPSNFGIALTLLLFPWVGITPPYQFTEHLGPLGDWALPAVIVCSGTFLNARYTGRLPLLLAWAAGFVGQAALRSLLLDARFGAALLPMTGMAWLLFSFYMVTDPPTTPARTGRQIAFGLSVAAVYGLLMVAHVVFGLFFALGLVTAARGLFLYARSLSAAPAEAEAPLVPGVSGGEVARA